jgi:hypothetical protein
MSQYKSPRTEIEFTKRTLSIIEQYKERECYLVDQYFDVTLLLNCLLGLIVLPRESKLNSITDCELPNKIKSTIIYAKDKNENSISLKFNEYIIGLRNGIVHFGAKNSLTFLNDEGKINAVEIIGNTNHEQHEIKYRFNLTNGNEIEDAVKAVLNHIYI